MKAEATRKAEAYLAPDAVFGSNTSTLPISGLAENSERPENFIGVHFFSPVDKMMLVEIILGKRTGKAALAKVVDYVLKIKKTPIVVHDSRGFYTSRCFATYLMEGMAMLEEGYAPALIDNVGRMTGMPRGPLEMHDDVALDLSYKVAKQTREDLGPAYLPNPGEDIVAKMVSRARPLWPQERQGLLRLSERRLAQAPVARPGRARAGEDQRTPRPSWCRR